MQKFGHPVRGSASGRPIMVLLDALGKRWTLRILWELRGGNLTFRDLRAKCDDVSPTSLNKRLKELRELSLVELTEAGFGYTRWGRELTDQFVPLTAWSEKWAADTDRSE